VKKIFIERPFSSHLLRFFYKPITLSVLSVGIIVLAYVATTQDVLEEGQDKRRVYVFILSQVQLK
jgi:hypothetical protein